jgi:D-lactate dehydrogenase
MRIAFFSTKSHDQIFFDRASTGHEIAYLEPRLTADTAPLAAGFLAICAFVNDKLDAPVLRALAAGGTRLIALRSAGFNHVDLAAAKELGLTVVRVPAYSPHAVAEHAVAMILALNRKIYRAYNRVREGNFAIEGLLGFDLHGRTVGIIGTGKIGMAFARIMAGFGCNLLAHDPYPNPAAEAYVRYVPRHELAAQADIISLHCPLTPETHHSIDDEAISHMKKGVMIINTSRGALVDTRAVIAGLKSGKIGYLGLDVYEEEGDLFFQDLSDKVIQDDLFSRLLTFPNVVITGHQGFFTEEAVRNIAETTVANITAFETGLGVMHTVTVDKLA